MSSYDPDAITRVLQSAPDLQQTPGLALGVAGSTSPDPEATAESTGLALHSSALDLALNQIAGGTPDEKPHAHHGLLSTIGHAVGGAWDFVGHNVVKPVFHGLNVTLNMLTLPLHEVQHSYRYLRAMVDRHGIVGGLLAGLALAGGIAAGVATGGAGFGLMAALGAGALGATAGAELTSIYDRKTWNDVGNGYIDKAGYRATFGNDVVRAVTSGFSDVFGFGGTTHNKAGNIVGPGGRVLATAGDAAFVLGADPVSFAARGATQIDRFGGLGIQGRAFKTVDDMVSNPDRIMEIVNRRRDVGRAFDDFAKMGAGEINYRYPRLSGIAPDLGAATTREEVADVFRRAATAKAYTVPVSEGLPRTGVTRVLLRHVNDRLYDLGTSATKVPVHDEAGNVVRQVDQLNRFGKAYNAAQSYRPFLLDDKTLDIASKDFDPENPFSHRAVQQVLRFSQHPKVVAAVMDEYLAAAKTGDVATQANIYKNGIIDMLRAAGLPDTSPILSKLRGDLNEYDPGGLQDIYALDRSGRPIGRMGDRQLAVFQNQVGKFVLPDFVALRNELRYSKGGLWKALGKADQFFASRFTQNFFKPLALTTLGFAQRVSAGEVIPAIGQLGAGKVLSSQLHNAGRRLVGAAEYERLMTPELEKMYEHSQQVALAKNATKVRSGDHPVGDLMSSDQGFVYDPVHRTVINKPADLTASEHFVPVGDNTTQDFHSFLDANAHDLAREGHGVAGRVEDGRLRLGVVRYESPVRDVEVAGALSPEQRAVAKMVDLHDTQGRGVNHDLARLKRLATRHANGEIDDAGFEAGLQRLKSLDDYAVALRAVNVEEISQAAAKLGVTPSARELPHIAAAMTHTLWTASRHVAGRGALALSGKIIDEDFRQVAAMLALERGYMVNPALSTGHQAIWHEASPQTRAEGNIFRVGAHVPQKYQRTDGFTTFGISDEQHPAMWASAIKEAANDEGAQAIATEMLHHASAGRVIDGTDVAVEQRLAQVHTDWLERSGSEQASRVNKYLARAKTEQQSREEFAAVKAEAIRGLVYGQNGQLNKGLLEAIADGRKVGPDDLNAIPLDFRPARVKGPNIQPVPIRGLQRLTDAGFKKMIDPVINFFSREPIYVASVTREYKWLKPLIEDGTLTHSDALMVAETRASHNMLPLIHNTLLRSQMSDVFRNFFPFYFAQEQAYKRYAGVIIKNPEFGQRLNLARYAVVDNSSILEDGQSQFVVMPWNDHASKWFMAGAGALGVNVDAAVPAAFSGNLHSIKSVIPEMQLPGSSPLLSVPLKKLEEVFPELAPAVHPLVGDIAESQSLWEQIVPNNILRNLAVGTGLAHTRSYASSVNYAIANAARRAGILRDGAREALASGDRSKATRLMQQSNEILPLDGGDPMAQQRAIERLKNTARINYLFKALVATYSPLAPKMELGDVKLRADLSAEMKKAQGNPAVGIENFLTKHPDATPDVVFTTTTANNAKLPSTTAEVGKWLTDNKSLVEKYGYAAAYLMPQAKGGYDSSAALQERAMHLRIMRSPEDFLKQVYISAGASTYYDNYHAYQTLRDQIEASGDTAQLDQVQQAWRSWSSTYMMAHPVFAADLKSGQRQVTAQQTLLQLAQVFQRNDAPNTEQSQLVRGLLNNYNGYRQLYIQFSVTGNRQAKASLKAAWQDYLNQTQVRQPLLKNVIRGVFSELPPPVNDPSEQQLQDQGLIAGV